jgi:hypothetical protein
LPLITISPAPVQILKPQRGGLPDAQPQPRQHHQDREVPPPNRGIEVAAAQQPLDAGGIQRFDQRRQPPLRDGRERDGKVALDQPLDVQEAQQRPQPRDRGLRR